MNTSGSLTQCYRDEPALDNNNNINFTANNNNTTSLKLKQQITGQTGNSVTKNFEIMVLLKYLTKFRRTHQIRINCEINLQLKWPKICVLVALIAANQVLEFKITDTKLYVLIVTLSAQDNVKQGNAYLIRSWI